SRLFAEIDTNRSRSSSGWRKLSASASTRSLKASQESSRLIKRAAEWKSTDAISTGWALVLTSALPMELEETYRCGVYLPGERVSWLVLVRIIDGHAVEHEALRCPPMRPEMKMLHLLRHAKSSTKENVE